MFKKSFLIYSVDLLLFDPLARSVDRLLLAGSTGTEADSTVSTDCIVDTTVGALAKGAVSILLWGIF